MQMVPASNLCHAQASVPFNIAASLAGHKRTKALDFSGDEMNDIGALCSDVA